MAKKITVSIQADIVLEATALEEKIIEAIHLAIDEDNDDIYDKLWDSLEEGVRKRLKETCGDNVEILDISYVSR